MNRHNKHTTLARRNRVAVLALWTMAAADPPPATQSASTPFLQIDSDNSGRFVRVDAPPASSLLRRRASGEDFEVLPVTFDEAAQLWLVSSAHLRDNLKLAGCPQRLVQRQGRSGSDAATPAAGVFKIPSGHWRVSNMPKAHEFSFQLDVWRSLLLSKCAYAETADAIHGILHNERVSRRHDIVHVRRSGTGNLVFVMAVAAGAEGEDPVLIVAFRGTQSLADMKADVNVTQSAPGVFSVLSGIKYDGKVHVGFYSRCVNFCFSQIIKAITDGSANGLRISRVIVTGHSLGGAIATIVGLELKSRLDEWRVAQRTSVAAADVRVITFGAPLCLNEAFGNAVHIRGWSKSFVHFINNNDVVPRTLTSSIAEANLQTFFDLFKDSIAIVSNPIANAAVSKILDIAKDVFSKSTRYSTVGLYHFLWDEDQPAGPHGLSIASAQSSAVSVDALMARGMSRTPAGIRSVDKQSVKDGLEDHRVDNYLRKLGDILFRHEDAEDSFGALVTRAVSHREKLLERAVEVENFVAQHFHFSNLCDTSLHLVALDVGPKAVLNVDVHLSGARLSTVVSCKVSDGLGDSEESALHFDTSPERVSSSGAVMPLVIRAAPRADALDELSFSVPVTRIFRVGVSHGVWCWDAELQSFANANAAQDSAAKKRSGMRDSKIDEVSGTVQLDFSQIFVHPETLNAPASLDGLVEFGPPHIALCSLTQPGLLACKIDDTYHYATTYKQYLMTTPDRKEGT